MYKIVQISDIVATEIAKIGGMEDSLREFLYKFIVVSAKGVTL